MAYSAGVLQPIITRRPPPGLLLCAAWLVLIAGCGGEGAAADSGMADAAGADTEPAGRTISIELLRTGERVLETDDAGLVTYRKMTPIGGVEVCVAQRRSAFDLFQPFTALARKICKTNSMGKPVRLTGVPANSDLLITYTKEGYQPVMTTFRTDEYDIALQDWADKADESTYYLPLLRDDAVLPVEDLPKAADTNGLVALWVYATGEYGVGTSAPVFNVDADTGVAQADRVNVKIEEADGTAVVDLVTRRDRPLFVSLPEGSYRFAFTHPVMELLPFGVQEQFMFGGLPTDAFNAIEVPVTRGRLTLAVGDGYCPLPADPAQPFKDLATCTLGKAAGGAAP